MSILQVQGSLLNDQPIQINTPLKLYFWEMYLLEKILVHMTLCTPVVYSNALRALVEPRSWLHTVLSHEYCIKVII